MWTNTRSRIEIYFTYRGSLKTSKWTFFTKRPRTPTKVLRCLIMHIRTSYTTYRLCATVRFIRSVVFLIFGSIYIGSWAWIRRFSVKCTCWRVWTHRRKIVGFNGFYGLTITTGTYSHRWRALQYLSCRHYHPYFDPPKRSCTPKCTVYRKLPKSSSKSSVYNQARNQALKEKTRLTINRTVAEIRYVVFGLPMGTSERHKTLVGVRGRFCIYILPATGMLITTCEFNKKHHSKPESCRRTQQNLSCLIDKENSSKSWRHKWNRMTKNIINPRLQIQRAQRHTWKKSEADESKRADVPQRCVTSKYGIIENSELSRKWSEVLDLFGLANYREFGISDFFLNFDNLGFRIFVIVGLIPYAGCAPVRNSSLLNAILVATG